MKSVSVPPLVLMHRVAGRPLQLGTTARCELRRGQGARVHASRPTGHGQRGQSNHGGGVAEPRCAEILELFRSQVYGRSPAAPQAMSCEVTSVDPQALGGKARAQGSLGLFHGRQARTENGHPDLPSRRHRPPRAAVRRAEFPGEPRHPQRSRDHPVAGVDAR